jgi:hypothetical protein
MHRLRYHNISFQTVAKNYAIQQLRITDKSFNRILSLVDVMQSNSKASTYYLTPKLLPHDPVVLTSGIDVTPVLVVALPLPLLPVAVVIGPSVG